MRRFSICCAAILLGFSPLVNSAKAEDFVPSAELPQPSSKVNASFERIITALGNGDYDEFVADGAPEFKEKLKPKSFMAVSKQLSPLIKGGYAPTFLTILQQQGCEVYAWKISFRGRKSDLLAKLAVYEGKVVGFWIQ
jgi:hypothetical protein